MRAQLLHKRLQDVENQTSILGVDDLDRIQNRFLHEYNTWRDVVSHTNPDHWGISSVNDDSFIIYRDHLPYVEYRVQVI